jgi:hypothetical protein
VAPPTASVLSSVNIFDEDIGKQLDEMRPAAGFRMDALDPAVAPERSKREVG